MTNDDIFQIAEANGWVDDFGRWNFTDDGLLDLVFQIRKAEIDGCAKAASDADLLGGFPDTTQKYIVAAIEARIEK